MKGMIAGLLVSLLILVGCQSYRGELTVTAQQARDVFISPANQDGVQDGVRVAVQVPKPYRDMVLASVSITVAAEDRRVVRTMAHTPAGPAAARAAESFVEAVVWDGRDDRGAFVADGKYVGTVEVTDRRGNTGRSPLFTAVVDNMPPSLDVSSPYAEFSPNGDGRLDTYPIRQRSFQPREGVECGSL